MSRDFDQHMMQIALRLAARGLGNVAPNPAVGAVIADEATGEVMGRGWTQPGGRPHAETEAIRRAGRSARGATMYVTLEPCSHHGKTPPCVNAIINAGLRRVVVAIEDPDSRVAGRGLAWLRDAGVIVDVGLGADAARRVALGHILRVTERRPFVQLKLALSAQGEVPRGGAGRPSWVTGPLARAHGAMLRAEADAILVGARTIADDDPQLTCRLPGLVARSPVRVVLSSTLDMPLASRVFDTAGEVPTWVLTTDEPPRDRVARLRAMGVAVVPVAPKGPLDVREALGALADDGITRLLVEGGPQVWRAFSDAGVVDEVVVYQARVDAREAGRAAAAYVNLNGFACAGVLNLAQDDVAVFRSER